MQRLALALIVGVLTLSASGVSSLIVAEPCTGYELPGEDDDACPPTCVTCGCCAQAAEPVMIAAANFPVAALTDLVSVLPQFPTADPRDILHVPKLGLA